MSVAAELHLAHAHDRDGFLRALLGQMSLSEKLGQLSLYSVAQDLADPFNPIFHPFDAGERLEAIRQGLVGGLFNAVGVDPLRELQRVAVEQSRLGIPLIFAADVIHGFRTIFPVPLAEMATWDPELARRTARATAAEASSAGVDWTFAPGVDVARDARWGRIVESSGEDVLLAARFAAARVRGFQHDDLAHPNALMATAKHFAGYGAAEAGLDYNCADISWRTLQEHYLPPFKAAVDAGVGAIMTAFNDVDGIPCTANETLLTSLLRRQWGFGGLIVSDYASDHELIAHGLADGPRQAALLALRAGLDISLESGLFAEHGADLVESGELPEAAIDAAVMRMLGAKHALGLFGDPFRRLGSSHARTDLPVHRPLAREAAARSAVLLKNDGVLPLREGSKIAVIGPLADDRENLNGCWSLFGSGQDSITLRQALLARFGEEDVVFARGCDLAEAIDGGLESARAAATAADVVILALGESERWSGEARSRADIDLPPAQLELLHAVSGSGKPVVVVLSTGRPLPLAKLEPWCAAIVVGWFLGSESGTGLSDILTGAAAPRGRLPVSFPRHAGQLPLYYNRKSTGRPWRGTGEPFRATYGDVSPTPLYPFGFGLTYTSFDYGRTEAESFTFSAERPLIVSATITNTGQRRGDTLAQLYVRDLAASVVRPLRELKEFEWISLEAGESRDVAFKVGAEQLGHWNAGGAYVSEPGAFEVWVSDHAEAGSSVLVTLLSEGEAPAGKVEEVIGTAV